jgi:hypothetical protein
LQKLAQQIEIGVVNKPNNLVKLFFKILLWDDFYGFVGLRKKITTLYVMLLQHINNWPNINNEHMNKIYRSTNLSTQIGTKIMV